MGLTVCSRLELEQGSRRMEQLEVAQCRQQMQLMADENVRLRKEVEVRVFFRRNSVLLFLLRLVCLGTSYLEQRFQMFSSQGSPKYDCEKPISNIYYKHQA